ncbi:unnamed protein product [Pleuronectes platessa]|uniref:Uncharacterized protein n=1 Tax=Pleuronectes platessa TaxID=8262 RepID=A0A9N7TXP9_PLEPL|nr:unnamed protein product [Pleuronectes platessa]
METGEEEEEESRERHNKMKRAMTAEWRGLGYSVGCEGPSENFYWVSMVMREGVLSKGRETQVLEAFKAAEAERADERRPFFVIGSTERWMRERMEGDTELCDSPTAEVDLLKPEKQEMGSATQTRRFRHNSPGDGAHPSLCLGQSALHPLSSRMLADDQGASIHRNWWHCSRARSTYVHRRLLVYESICRHRGRKHRDAPQKAPKLSGA